MTSSEVTAYITLHLQPNIDPVISSDELALIVDQAKRADSNGLAPSDPDWVETYDLAAAVATGWEIKAAKAAGGYAFTDNGQTLHREQIYTQCLAQAKIWRHRCGASVSITPDSLNVDVDDTELEIIDA